MNKLPREFYNRDTVQVARELLGQHLVRILPDGTPLICRITETEAYRGEEDTACHAHKGRTPRTEVLYREAGTIYVYLCYGMHWLLNVVTGEEGHPQAVLIRACEGAEGPGRLTKKLGVDKQFHTQNIADLACDLWIEDDGYRCEILTDKRVGIGYATQEDQDKLWRFKVGEEITSQQIPFVLK